MGRSRPQTKRPRVDNIEQVTNPKADYSPRPVELEYEMTWSRELRPTNPDLSGTIRFEIPNDMKGVLIDLGQTQFETDVNILKDRTSSDPSERYPTKSDLSWYMVNNIHHTMWKHVDVKVAGTAVTENSKDYHYKAYIDTLLSTTDAAASVFGYRTGWVLDDHKHMDWHAPDRGQAVQNKSSEDYVDADSFAAATKENVPSKRNRWWFDKPDGTLGSYHSVIFRDKIKTQPFQQSKLCPWGFPIDVEFERNDKRFIFMMNAGDDKMALEVKKMCLWITYVRLVPEVFERLRANRQQKMITMPITRSVMIRKELPMHVTEFQDDSIFGGRKIPTNVIFVFQTQKAFSGAWNLNPFNFENIGINHLYLLRNNQQIPMQPFEPIWSEMKCSRELDEFYHATGFLFKNVDPQINRYMWMNDGFHIWALDLTPDRKPRSDVERVTTTGSLGWRFKTADVPGKRGSGGSATFDAMYMLVFCQYREALQFLPDMSMQPTWYIIG